MRLRLNVTLPEETVRLIDHVSGKGNRSRFIDHAVRHYAGRLGKRRLSSLLREGAERRAERDLRLAHDWFPLEEAAWQRKGK